jgi:RHS repeat-associated protein
MWTWRDDGLLNDSTGTNSKHIYLGETRLVTKIGRADGSFTGEEKAKQYWYHSDHLGSAQLITNIEGEEYERIEYTPYGELWVERASAASNIDIPYRFTGKERDEETGLYYYGARYLDPKTSRWLSTDPALSDYIPGASINDEAKKRNSELPGMGGVFNTVNLHLYHYAGNNPVKYTDPTGMVVDYAFVSTQEGRQQLNGYVPNNDGVAIGRSGVTIATGFDLGQHNTYDLNRIFGRGENNSDLRAAFTPYLGLQRQDAIDYLAENPLSLTQEQADRTDAAIMAGSLSLISAQYNSATGGNFADLPDQAQTALFDMGYQLGVNSGIPDNIMQAINSGNYSGAADLIQAMPGYADRRTNEANLLRQLPNTNENTQ